MNQRITSKSCMLVQGNWRIGPILGGAPYYLTRPKPRGIGKTPGSFAHRLSGKWDVFGADASILSKFDLKVCCAHLRLSDASDWVGAPMLLAGLVHYCSAHAKPYSSTIRQWFFWQVLQRWVQSSIILWMSEVFKLTHLSP